MDVDRGHADRGAGGDDDVLVPDGGTEDALKAVRVAVEDAEGFVHDACEVWHLFELAEVGRTGRVRDVVLQFCHQLGVDGGVCQDVVGGCFESVGGGQGTGADGDLCFAFDSLGAFFGFWQAGRVHEGLDHRGAPAFFVLGVVSLFADGDGLLK